MEINLISDDEQTEYEVPIADQHMSEEFSSGLSAQAGDRPVITGNPMFKKAIRWLVYTVAFLLPLWFLPFTADKLEFNKQFLLVAIAGIGLILYLLDVVKSGTLRYKKSSFYWPLAGIVFAAVISVIFSVNRYTSIFGTGSENSFSLVSLASLVVLFFLAVSSIEDRGRVLKSIIVFSWALTFLFGALQVLGLFIFKGVFATRAFNTVGLVNSLAILAAIGLSFFYNFVSGLSAQSGLPAQSEDDLEKTKFEKLAGFVCYPAFVVCLFLVVLANWWPIWTVAFVSLLACAGFNSRESLFGDLRSGKMKLFVGPLAVIVLGLFLMLTNFNLFPIKSKLPIEVAPAYGVSLEIAGQALSVRPLGYGLENFPIAYYKFKPVSIANTVFYQTRFEDSTSEIMNLPVEGGILMILAFLSLLWFYSKELVASFKSKDKNLNFIWAASLGFFVAFFLYPFNITLMVFLVLMLVLISLGRNNQEKVLNLEESTRHSFVGSLAFILGLVLVLVAGYFCVNNYLADVYLQKALATSDKNQSISLFVKSLNSNPNDTRAYQFLSQIMIVQLADDIKKGPQNKETNENYNSRMQNQMVSAVNVAVQATKVNPADSENWANLSTIYQNLVGLVGGADQAAVNANNESLKRNPNDPVAYLRLGNIYLSAAYNIQRVIDNPPKDQAGKINFAAARSQVNSNLSNAEINFKKAISLYGNFGQALYNLAAVYDREGKVPEAIKQFEKLQASNPNDPSIVFQLGLLYYRNSQKDNAFKAWQKAVLLFPSYSNARWYLSLIYEERGDIASALAQVEEIQKSNPDDQMVVSRLDQLRAGKRTIPPDKLLSKQPLNK